MESGLVGAPVLPPARLWRPDFALTPVAAALTAPAVPAAERRLDELDDFTVEQLGNIKIVSVWRPTEWLAALPAARNETSHSVHFNLLCRL